ncbi:(d)CMP kinase [Methanohalophilus euhalobius]|uniref:Cytidylate kinase n=1 Tax=Methanohalophilus euhalobius TaxID=51203 RepID=A0A314ZYL5_9EURY|nr:AAA family ATPase [Methanohalophilus euhalobius]PQV43760.1 cytidylate kinase [Methanohalophilus euhalobius]RNI12750.1 cytidylate kinase [Methanohalophilus euhalobius]
MLVTISGLPGSGTTTVSRMLASYYAIEMISAGDVFRNLAKEHSMSLGEFGKLAESDPAIDRMIDERQQDIALSRDNIILEGRLAGHMAGDEALCIWLKASRKVRVERIVGREGSSFEAKLNETIERESCEALRYREIYDIDINDLSIYDLVIESNRWNQYQICDILKTAIDNLGGFFNE